MPEIRNQKVVIGDKEFNFKGYFISKQNGWLVYFNSDMDSEIYFLDKNIVCYTK
jgi:hypothetical protein